VRERERERESERERERHTHTHLNVGIRDCVSMPDEREYGVATVSRIDKIIGLVCRIASLL